MITTYLQFLGMLLVLVQEVLRGTQSSLQLVPPSLEVVLDGSPEFVPNIPGAKVCHKSINTNTGRALPSLGDMGNQTCLENNEIGIRSHSMYCRPGKINADIKRFSLFK
jgi:hypothetical protein